MGEVPVDIGPYLCSVVVPGFCNFVVFQVFYCFQNSVRVLQYGHIHRSVSESDSNTTCFA